MKEISWNRKKISNVKSIKKLFRVLYEGFPLVNLREDMVKTVFVKEIDVKSLVRHGYLIEEQIEDKMWYSLGSNGLLLINAWEMENLTRKIAWLTYAIFLFDSNIFGMAVLGNNL